MLDPGFEFKNADQRALIAKLALERKYLFHKDKRKGRKNNKKKKKKGEQDASKE